MEEGEGGRRGLRRRRGRGGRRGRRRRGRLGMGMEGTWGRWRCIGVWMAGRRMMMESSDEETREGLLCNPVGEIAMAHVM